MKNRIKDYLNRYPKVYFIVKELYIIQSKTKMNIKNIVYGLYGHIVVLFPIKQKKIVFCNYFGKGYGDNGKYIAEEIIRQGLQYDVVWLLKKELVGKVESPAQIRIVKYDSLRGLYELATAKLWIDNCRKTFYPPKRKEQFYIQTWHGALGMKKCERDAENALSKEYIKEAKKDSKMIDLCISNGNHITNIYKNSFWYEGDILKFGSPRNDILIRTKQETKQKVLSTFNLEESIKIALYAPTFRKNENTHVYNIDYKKAIEALENEFQGTWVILVRLHPNISAKASGLIYDNKVINATNYDDMQELLAISDVLITDYSSCSFDFALTKRPCFLYVPDMNEYMNDRDFYFSLDTLPFSYSMNNEELFANVAKFDQDEYIKKLNIFYNSQDIIEDGQASKRVVEKIKEIIES